MVKTGQAWAGTFVCLDATGALEAGTPSGVLYVDGVADAATVTITGSNPYKWAVTLPSLTAGQRVDMYITATISTIATAGFVASEQADTALVSEVKAETALIVADTGTDGVKINATQGAITWGQQKIVANVAGEGALDIYNSNATGIGQHNKGASTGMKNIGTDDYGLLNYSNNGIGQSNEGDTKNVNGYDPALALVGSAMTLADDAITSAKFDESTAFPVKSADTGATQIARVGADSDTLETLSDEIAAVKAETNELQGELANGGRTYLLIDGIKAKTDLIPASPAESGEYTADFTQVAELLYSIMGGEGWTDETLVSIQSAIEALDTNSVLLEAIDGTYTLKEVIYIMASLLGGLLTRSGDILTFRDLSDTTDVVVAETDEHKQRIAMTYTV